MRRTTSLLIGLSALLNLGIWGAFGPTDIALASLSVMTTTSDLEAIVREIGGSDVATGAFCKGTQDPHFLEPKPSYMVKANRADLVVAIGLGLEVGWLPSIVQGARNPKIAPGQPGYLEVGPLIKPLEVPEGKVTRAQGDVHPEGNPHATLDPIRVGEMAVAIAKRLGELDPPHASTFSTRADELVKRLAEKTKRWQSRIDRTGVKKIITFHKTLTYFFNRFHLENPAILEPLPGIPPTVRHTLDVIQRAKADKVSLILVENFFDSSAGERVAKDVPGMRVATVPVAVGGSDDVKSIDDLFERLVKAIEGKGSNG